MEHYFFSYDFFRKSFQDSPRDIHRQMVTFSVTIAELHKDGEITSEQAAIYLRNAVSAYQDVRDGKETVMHLDKHKEKRIEIPED